MYELDRPAPQGIIEYIDCLRPFVGALACEALYNSHFGIVAAGRTAAAIAPNSLVFIEGHKPFSDQTPKEAELGRDILAVTANLAIGRLKEGVTSTGYADAKKNLLGVLADHIEKNKDLDESDHADGAYQAALSKLLIEKDCAVFPAELDHQEWGVDAALLDRLERGSQRKSFTGDWLHRHDRIGRQYRTRLDNYSDFIFMHRWREYGSALQVGTIISNLFTKFALADSDLARAGCDYRLPGLPLLPPPCCHGRPA